MAPTRDKLVHSKEGLGEMIMKRQVVPMTKPVTQKNPPAAAAKQKGRVLIEFRSVKIIANLLLSAVHGRQDKHYSTIHNSRLH